MAESSCDWCKTTWFQKPPCTDFPAELSKRAGITTALDTLMAQRIWAQTRERGEVPGKGLVQELMPIGEHGQEPLTGALLRFLAILKDSGIALTSLETLRRDAGFVQPVFRQPLFLEIDGTVAGRSVTFEDYAGSIVEPDRVTLVGTAVWRYLAGLSQDERDMLVKTAMESGVAQLAFQEVPSRLRKLDAKPLPGEVIVSGEWVPLFRDHVLEVLGDAKTTLLIANREIEGYRKLGILDLFETIIHQLAKTAKPGQVALVAGGQLQSLGLLEELFRSGMPVAMMRWEYLIYLKPELIGMAIRHAVNLAAEQRSHVDAYSMKGHHALFPGQAVITMEYGTNTVWLRNRTME